VGWGFRGEGHQYNFYKLGRAKPVLFAAGGGSHFFRRGKNYSMSLLLKSTLLFANKHANFLENYVQGKLPANIDPNYLQVLQNYTKKLSFPN